MSLSSLPKPPGPGASLGSASTSSSAVSSTEAKLDAALIDAISAAVDAKLRGVSEKLDAALALDKTKPGAKAKSGLMSALQAAHAAPPKPGKIKVAAAAPAAAAPAAIPAAAAVAAAAIDDDDDDDEEKVPSPEPAATASGASSDRIAHVTLAQAASSSSVMSWIQLQNFQDKRNRRECLALAAAIDALLEDGVPVESTGLEILCRRLTAVHESDKNKNWDWAAAIEWPYAADSLLTHQLRARVVKDAAAISRLREKATKRSSGSKPTNRNQNTSSNNFKSKFGVGSKSAGAAQQ